MPVSARLQPQTFTALSQARAKAPDLVDSVLADVNAGTTSPADAVKQLQQSGTVEASTAKSSLVPDEIALAASLAFKGELFEQPVQRFDAATGGAKKAFSPSEGGRAETPLWDVQFGTPSTSAPLISTSQKALAGQPAAGTSVAGVYGATIAPKNLLKNVPGLQAIEALKAGDVAPKDVEAGLVSALLSTHPKVRKKAATTLQVAESYARKAEQDATNYAGTGFRPLPWPGLRLQFSSSQTKVLVDNLAKGRDGHVVDAMRMAAKRGLIEVSPKSALDAPRLDKIATGKSGRLKGSDGRESPREADSFHQEWVKEVEPGLQNIREAIINTATARGGSCPYAHGNHAKGVAFGDAKMAVNDAAPDWAKDLFGDQLSGGMLRVSGSQTNPDQPDSEAHMPGIRLAFPLAGALDGSATQLIDITANTGDSTHAQTAAEHTKFTQNISVPKGFLSGSKPVRALRHALGGIFRGKSPLSRVRQMQNAVEVTTMANDQRFDEHVFHARHAFFVGGRYVQVKFKVVEPVPFVDGRQDDRKDARLHAVSETVAKEGMKLAMYVTEIPEGQPDMVEVEGWKGLPSFHLGTIDVPAQSASPSSAASEWFEDVAHVPGGANKVFHAVGLGRHRVPIYEESGRMRQTPRH